MTTAGDRFLIVRLGALGDVIHGIPVVAALRARFPESRIDWVVDPRYVELLRHVRGLTDVVAVDPRAGVSRLWAAVRTLRERRYSAVFDLQGLLKSAMLARLARGRRTIGFPRSHLREPLATVFYSARIDPAGAAHVVRQNLALLTAVGVVTDRIEMPIDTAPTPASEAVSRQYERTGYIVLNPGAAWPNKRWPADRFAAVASAVHERFGLPSVVLWGPGEQELARAVAAASPDAAAVAPATTMTDVVAIAARARLVVSGDTGPAHIAAATGTPVVGLYGPTDPGRNGPWTPADVVVSRYARCSCQYERRCHEPSRCLDTIGAEDVVEAVRRAIGAAHA